mgnify:CR=1 FL=1
MKLFLLTCLTMTAFACNSLLNRLAVADYDMDPMVFAVIRTIAGAVMLSALLLARGHVPAFGRKQGAGAVALAAYMVGFSWAYLTLGAGLGALILFGVLQVVMFGFANTVLIHRIAASVGIGTMPSAEMRSACGPEKAIPPSGHALQLKLTERPGRCLARWVINASIARFANA